MATDSSELTFIRCPSCRSLVPAISTRCRMCGATLNTAASTGKDAASETKTSSRVRQRTVSLTSPPAEMEIAFTEPPATVIAPSIAAIPLPVEEKVAAPEIDPRDPLGAFLEEVPDDVPEVAIDDDNTGGFDSVAELFAKEKTLEAPINELIMDDNGDLPEKFEPASSRDPVSSRDNGKRNGFHPVKEEPIKDINTVEPMYEEPVPVVPVSMPVAAPVAPPLAVKPVETFKPVEPYAVKEKDAPAKEETEVLAAVTSKPVDSHKKGKSEDEAVVGSGKLVGWLVSYENPMGKGMELREGKFFVSKTSLKSNDLLLNDSSVSTPHALMKAVAGEGVLVQDLMSDRGVFIRKKTSDGYQKTIETVKLEHGDWIRFGDVEFLVCLIVSGR